MFFSQKTLRAWCILLSVAVLHACASYSRVEIPVDATWLAKQGAGVMVYRGIEYPIMKPRVRDDTLIFSRVATPMGDGTLGYLPADEMLPSDQQYRVQVDSAYELLTDQPVLRIPERAIAKVEMDVTNIPAVPGYKFLIFVGGLVLIGVIYVATTGITFYPGF